ncbi:hypothetical protein RvY_03702 [Ramazzottius varieornatus]|uniref:Guanosine-3',5'-bis(diphosphate) 3'-pyrophosphohydrolase MESH1 n=1 Tax=Ramazzottius varieornatus TaxID=947166 RepID=A0A1D1UYD8_RAMVA|nr:hypothetical protein RvY_03702 [Ramazzottius varieornatus]
MTACSANQDLDCHMKELTKEDKLDIHFPDVCRSNDEEQPSRKPTDQNDLALLLRTINFAAQKHSFQRRKDPEKTPYINHPIGVAHILASEGGITDVKVLQAAILHDTVEDTDTTLDEIEEEFGATIRHTVEEVTDKKALSYQERKAHQIARAPLVSERAKLVKLGDKLHNLRDLQRVRPVDWSQERVHQYFIWSGKVIEGLIGTNLPLEEKLRQLLATEDVILPTERKALSILEPSVSPSL